MSRPAGSARWTSVVVVAIILLGSLVFVSIVMERSGKSSLPVSFAEVGGRRMVIGTNGGLSDQSTLEDLRDGEDPLSSSKRRVPNGPDPIHNRYHLFLACNHGISLTLFFF